MSELEKLKARKALLDKKIAQLAKRQNQARRKQEDTAKFTLGALVMKLCDEQPQFRDKLLGIFYAHLSDDLEHMNDTRRAALKEVWSWDVRAQKSDQAGLNPAL